MEKDNKREAIILGALLHDIGKSVQRAQDNPKAKKHTEWGIEWFQQSGLRERPRLAEIFSPQELNGIDSAIESHHDGEKYISLADAISAGTDRTPLDREEEKGNPFGDRLISISSNISLSSQLNQKKYYKLAPLSNSLDEIFPTDDKNISPGEYQNLLQKFNEEIKLLNFKDKSIEQVINTIYFLLWKYTWCIPSAVYESEPDISLFDHLKTTAAIVTCLYDYEEKKSEDRESKFILVCGDLSGIQKFIYRISSKGAAKGLKGRSFYLQLLTESIAKYMLRINNYYIPNLLYVGGGRFYLLLDIYCKEIIQEAVKDINKHLLDKFMGELYLAVGVSEANEEDFMHDKFKNKWKEVSEKANRNKRRKYIDLDPEKFLKPFGRGGQTKICDVCKEEKELKPVQRGEEILKICDDCQRMEQIGLDLRNAQYILEVYKEKNDLNRGIYLDFLNTRYIFVSQNDLGILQQIKCKEANLFSINKTDFLYSMCNSSNLGLGFKFIGGTYAPYKDSEVLTFNDFANDASGRKYYGILRMDVDNLGQLFSTGLKDASISKISSLSRNLEIFFNGYINIITQKYEYKDSIYVIYSGGDDLFITGSWNKIPYLAKEIYDKFKEFNCNNPDITLSAGISILPPKYPIYKGAELAKKEEDKAKYLERNQKEKDAISFLGSTIGWHDFTISKEMTELIVNLIENENLTKGFLRKLRDIYLLYILDKTILRQKWKIPLGLLENKVKYYRWLWRMIYYLDRYTQKQTTDNLVKVKYALINNEFNGNKSEFDIISWLNLPVRWAEFLTTKEE